ncbi:hypothetical protein MRB53_007310 [Persea americana]|uniref:Uncharacterized protein n=1 Tax=Persea americana TaxID=3435 RepID=A0ACC2MIL5_PERAE|nr:hypothetical protein MRB53_007310 [Persea americana]
MGGLRKLMKRRKETTVTRNILSLPRDMLASILASVASSSVIDLVEAKRTCQGFYEAASDYLVFRRVTLESVYGTSWTANSPEKSSFLKQCEEMGNPDALCNLGMYHFFSYREYELGLNLLKKCVDSGHLYASYALGMILLSNRGSHLEAIETRIRGLKRVPNLRLRNVRKPDSRVHLIS